MKTKEMKITQDKTQTRATIPGGFVKKHKITKQHRIQWKSRGKELTGVLIQPQVSKEEDAEICKAISQKEVSVHKEGGNDE